MIPFFVVGGVCIIFAVPLLLLSSKVPCKHLLHMHSDQPYYCIVENIKEENLHEFCGFRAIHKSFLHKIWACRTPYDRF